MPKKYRTFDGKRYYLAHEGSWFSNKSDAIAWSKLVKRQGNRARIVKATFKELEVIVVAGKKKIITKKRTGYNVYTRSGTRG